MMCSNFEEVWEIMDPQFPNEDGVEQLTSNVTLTNQRRTIKPYLRRGGLESRSSLTVEHSLHLNRALAEGVASDCSIPACYVFNPEDEACSDRAVQLHADITTGEGNLHVLCHPCGTDGKSEMASATTSLPGARLSYDCIRAESETSVKERIPVSSKTSTLMPVDSLLPCMGRRSPTGIVERSCRARNTANELIDENHNFESPSHGGYSDGISCSLSDEPTHTFPSARRLKQTAWHRQNARLPLGRKTNADAMNKTAKQSATLAVVNMSTSTFGVASDFHDAYCSLIEPVAGISDEREAGYSKPFKCDFCPARHKTKKIMRKHVKKKHPESFVDLRCEKRVVLYSGALAASIPSHEPAQVILAEKDDFVLYPCDICAQEFRSRHECIQHVQAHAAEDSGLSKVDMYWCTVCLKSFKKSFNYNRHMRKKHPSRSSLPSGFTCQMCNSSFPCKGKLLAHRLKSCVSQAERTLSMAATPEASRTNEGG